MAIAVFIIAAISMFFAYTSYAERHVIWGLPALVITGLVGLVAAFLSFGFFWTAVATLIGVMCVASHAVRRNHAAWGRPLAMACTAAVACLAIGRTVLRLVYSEREKAANAVEKRLEDQDRERERAAGVALGKYLMRQHGIARILVIADATFDEARFEAIMAAVSEGSEKSVDIKAVEKVGAGMMEPPASGANASPGDFEMPQTRFERVVLSHLRCNLILSFVPLPQDFEKMRFMRRKEGQRPKIVLMNASVMGLQEAIASGLVSAAIIGNPQVRRFDSEAEPPATPEEIFNEHYLLIDAGNVANIAGRYPHLFHK